MTRRRPRISGPRPAPRAAHRISLVGLLGLLLLVPACRSKPDQPPIPARRSPVAKGAGDPLSGLPDVSLWYAVWAGGQHVGARHVQLEILGRPKTRAKTNAKSANGAPAPSDLPVARIRFRIDQRIRLRVGDRESFRQLQREEVCAADGTLLGLEQRRLRDGAATSTRRYARRRGDLRAEADGAVVKPPADGQPISGRCALWLAFLRKAPQGAAPKASLYLLDPQAGTVNPGLLTAADAHHGPGVRFVDVRDPRISTGYHLAASGLPRTIRIRGVGLPLELRLSTRAAAEAPLRASAATPASALALDVGARLPEPLSLRRVRFALQLRQPLTAAERTAFTGPYQRLLGGAAGTPAATATTLTLETRRPGALPPAVLNLAFPPPDNAFPAAARPWLRPGLLPRLGPRSPLRAAVAREVAGAKTSLEAALRLTRWAGPAAPRHGRSAAALLVAALRAVGLPARLAFGLLYVGSVATEHTWAEVNLGPWLPLDPEVGGVAGAAHLRLAVSPGAPAPSPAPTSADTAPPERDPRADWRQLRDRLRGLKVRLLEAVLATGFHFVPGNPLQFQVRANVLQDRVWNLVVRRPLFAPTTRFVLPGPRDDFVVRVVGTQGELRLTLHIYAASAAGLDARVFAVRGYRPRKIGRETYIVKTTASGKGTLKRTYVQFACAPGPWAARIVRFTLVARGVTPTAVAALEQKTLGTFQQLGRTAQITSCPRTARRVAPRPAAPKPAAPLPPMRPAVRPTVPMRPAARPTVPMRPATRPSAPRPRPARPARRIAPRR